MNRLAFILVLFLFISACKEPQIKITPLEGFPSTSKRGLFLLPNGTAWSSGSGGIIFMNKKGRQWCHHQDTILSNLDFRDVHGFNENEAIIMSSGDGCQIYKTIDGGESWELVYENMEEGVFFDGMDFWDDQYGMAFSDPINGELLIIETKNGGGSWNKLSVLPQTLRGEAGFAASGTGIVCIGERKVIIGTGGGERARVFVSEDRGLSWETYDTPMKVGEAGGIYSMTFLDEENGVVVGGNYLDSNSAIGNCAITKDGGQTWVLPDTPPNGYRSCVAHNKDGMLICTGRTGVDVSFDQGKNWKSISKDGYYSCVIGKKYGWLTGRKGKLAKISIK